jgi:DNA-binding NarL/FixJ family response regulator
MSVLLVEDDPTVRSALATLLAREGGLSVAAACGTGAEALRILEGPTRLDLALVDLGLPDRAGAEVVRAVRARRPTAVVLVLTVFDDERTVLAALRAGAHGYVLKDEPPEALLRAVREALAGGAPLSAPVRRHLVRSFWPDEPLPRLPSPRERELLALLTLGLTYEEAARHMGVELGTVQGYVKTLYGKLGVATKVEAVEAARRHGLVAVDPGGDAPPEPPRGRT